VKETGLKWFTTNNLSGREYIIQVPKECWTKFFKKMFATIQPCAENVENGRNPDL